MIRLLVLCLVLLAGPAWGAMLTLTWTDNSSNEQGFRIERKAGLSGTFAEIATVAMDTTSFLDPNLPEGTEFCYQVKAYNSTGSSAPTNEDCGTTIVTPPLPIPPTGAVVGGARVIIILP